MKRQSQTHYEARLRVARTKHAMDAAQEKFEAAEAEWFEACRELDRLDGVEIPTAAEVRGILKPR